MHQPQTWMLQLGGVSWHGLSCRQSIEPQSTSGPCLYNYRLQKPQLIYGQGGVHCKKKLGPHQHFPLYPKIDWFVYRNFSHALSSPTSKPGIFLDFAVSINNHPTPANFSTTTPPDTYRSKDTRLPTRAETRNSFFHRPNC